MFNPDYPDLDDLIGGNYVGIQEGSFFNEKENKYYENFEKVAYRAFNASQFNYSGNPVGRASSGRYS